MLTNIEPAKIFGQTDNHITWLSEHVGINSQVLPALKAMQADAIKDGIDIHIASGFRSFERQLHIWNRKVCGELTTKDQSNAPVDLTVLSPLEKLDAILLYSALPGTSRHHWGTDIDVYSPNLLPTNTKLQLEPWEYQKHGPFEKLSIWLNNNAAKFGFFFPYQKYKKGVAPEPWHLSYAPLANQYQQCAAQYTNELSRLLSDSTIELSSTVIAHLDYIMKQYVFNITKAEINNE